MKQCKYPECNDKTGKLSLGWCKRHYDRWRRSGSPDFPPPRNLKYWILSRTVQVDDCLIWNGPTTDPHGRGDIRWNGRAVRAHRVIWELEHGNIGKGLQIRHTCDVMSCLNINHMLIGTHADNMRDKKERGRGRLKICKNGLHEMDGNNLYIMPSNAEYRECRKCRNERNKRYHKRKENYAKNRKVA